MTQPAALRVIDLTKSYPSPGGGLRVLDGVILELGPGDSLAVMPAGQEQHSYESS